MPTCRVLQAIEACAVHTRSAFLLMADAVVVAAEHVVEDMHTTLQGVDQQLAQALAERKAATEDIAACEKESKEALTVAESVNAKYDVVAAKLKDLSQAHNQLRAEQEAAAAAAASVTRLEVVHMERQEWCTLKGQAKLLRARLELMLEARTSSDKLSQQLRDLAQGGVGAASAEALTTLKQRVEELQRWAAEQSSFSLDAELKRALSIVKSKVEIVVVTLEKLMGDRDAVKQAPSDDPETLELLKTVANLGVEAADRVGQVDVKQANESVLLAIEQAKGGAASGDGKSLSTAKSVLADLEPALEATAYFSSCLQVTITAWAAFSMQLAREAAKDTSLSDMTSRLTEQVAAEVARQRQQSQAGIDIVQRQAMDLEQQEAELSVTAVLAAAGREVKVSWTQLEEAKVVAHSGQENVQRISAAIDKLLGEISAAVQEAKLADEEVLGRQGMAQEQLQRAVQLAIAAETNVWRARRAAPASAHPDWKLPEGEPKEAAHVSRAQAAVQACAEALEVLALMRLSIPPALRSAEAADRMLVACQARVAAAAARAAAEWGRTAALCCESQLADQEWHERVAACLAGAEKRDSKDQTQLLKLQEAKADAKQHIQMQLDALLGGFYAVQGHSATALPEALQRVQVLVSGKPEAPSQPVEGPASEAPLRPATGAPVQPAVKSATSSSGAWVLKQVQIEGETRYLHEQTKLVYTLGAKVPLLIGSWNGTGLVPARPSAVGE